MLHSDSKSLIICRTKNPPTGDEITYKCGVKRTISRPSRNGATVCGQVNFPAFPQPNLLPSPSVEVSTEEAMLDCFSWNEIKQSTVGS